MLRHYPTQSDTVRHTPVRPMACGGLAHAIERRRPAWLLYCGCVAGELPDNAVGLAGHGGAAGGDRAEDGRRRPGASRTGWIKGPHEGRTTPAGRIPSPASLATLAGPPRRPDGGRRRQAEVGAGGAGAWAADRPGVDAARPGGDKALARPRQGWAGRCRTVSGCVGLCRGWREGD